MLDVQLFEKKKPKYINKMKYSLYKRYSQLDGGTASREDFFAGSIEFDALCKSYGINA